MARLHEPEDTEPDHQEAGTNADQPLPFDHGECEGKHYYQHREEIADGQRPKRREECA